MFADDENPYAAPKSDLVEIEHYTDGRDLAWRDGKKLVVRKGAELPDRCIKCNAPAGGYRYSRTLEWVKPIWLVTLFLGLLLFALVYLIVRKKGKITVGLCEVHRRRRTRAIAWGWLSALAGIAGSGAPARSSED